MGRELFNSGLYCFDACHLTYSPRMIHRTSSDTALVLIDVQVGVDDHLIGWGEW